MTTKQRIMTIRLLEQIDKQPGYAKRLGIQGHIVVCQLSCGGGIEEVSESSERQCHSFRRNG